MNLTVPIHHHAKRYPRKLAVISGSASLTFAQLDALVWRAARFLRSEGLGAGDRVGLAYADPMLHLVVALALARIGVGHYAIAPEEGPAMIDATMRRISAKAVLGPTQVNGLITAQMRATSAQLFSAAGASLGEFADGSNLAWRFVTSSGTTGMAKLFAVSQRHLVSLAGRFALAVPTTFGDVSAVITNIWFYFAIRRIFHDLMVGSTVVLSGNATFAGIAELIVKQRINRLHLGPWTISRMMQLPYLDKNLRHLTVMECSGSQIGNRLRREVIDRYTDGLVVTYGTNEVAPISTALGQHCLSAPDTIGWPVPRGELQIVDDSGALLGPGLAGQIRVRDADMIDRYWDDEAATARAFRDGWFYPGDVAAWSERGELLFKGRADDMIIFDGVNIFPAEIENCLMEHPFVLEAAAFGVSHPIHGAVPWAAVRVNDDVTPAALQDFVRERLGVRHPRQVAVMPEFPRNPRGKPLKREIARAMQALAAG